MDYQLREYTVKPGAMDEWIKEWREKIAPLRVKAGFEVVGAWTLDGTDRFVWIIGYHGPKSWEDAEKDYYGSPERKAMNPDPVRHLTHQESRRMSDVPRTTA